MRTIEVSDEAYARLSRQAGERGVTIGAYIEGFVEAGDPDVSHVLTPEIIVECESIARRMAEGVGCLSPGELEARFGVRRSASEQTLRA